MGTVLKRRRRSIGMEPWSRSGIIIPFVILLDRELRLLNYYKVL